MMCSFLNGLFETWSLSRNHRSLPSPFLKTPQNLPEVGTGRRNVEFATATVAKSTILAAHRPVTRGVWPAPSMSSTSTPGMLAFNGRRRERLHVAHVPAQGDGPVPSVAGTRPSWPADGTARPG